MGARARESGQRVLLAAGVVLPAGGLPRAEAVGPASVAPAGVVPIAPASAHADFAMQAGAPRAPERVLTIPSQPAAGLLPPGFAAGGMSSTSNADHPQRSAVPPVENTQPPPAPPPVTVQYAPGPSGCYGGTV